MNWFKSTTFNAIAGSASIVGLGLAVYALFFIKTRQPVFYVDQGDWVTLIDRDKADQASIKVLDENDEVTTGNIVAARFYFWNDGKESIKFEENVLAYGGERKQEITIRLEGDPNARILDFSCPAIPRQEVINFHLKSAGEQALKLNFDILENEDGAGCQIIFESSEEVNLSIYGAIEGVKQGFLTKDSLMLAFRSASWLFLLVFIGIIAWIFYCFRPFWNQEFEQKSEENRSMDVPSLLNKIKSLAAAITMIFFGSSVAIMSAIDSWNSFNDGFISSPIPREIRKLEANQNND